MTARVIIFMFATMLAISASNTSYAANPFKYEEFGWIVSDMKDMMLEHCRQRGTPVMDATGILAPLNDAHNFRRACGQGLHDQSIPGETHWKFHYARLTADDGDQDYLGLQRLVDWNGAEYSLVVSWETRRQTANGETLRVQAYPSVVLFQHDGDLWRPVWNYSNAVKNTWNDPWDYDQNPDWTTLTLSDLKGIMMEYVIGDYPGVFWNLKDARNIGFP